MCAPQFENVAIGVHCCFFLFFFCSSKKCIIRENMSTLKEKMDQMFLKLNCRHKIKFYLDGQPIKRRRQQIMSGV